MVAAHFMAIFPYRTNGTLLAQRSQEVQLLAFVFCVDKSELLKMREKP